ncbi:MAG: hypothetical protein RL329_3596, partial [Bacteroidota bacterium]
LQLAETKHPNQEAENRYDQLIGIDFQKECLLQTLALLLHKDGVSKWQKQHHPKGLNIINQLDTGTPLIILSGEVGCGKTVLAQHIATPLSQKLNTKILVFETPSNIRGSGLVGEISNRITAAFDIVKRKLKGEIGILIIDEADDLATKRSQNEAHHEDRAGLNVLIKQLDLIKRDKVKLAVILITNRLNVLDPAIRRRASLELLFERPNKTQLEQVFKFLFAQIVYSNAELEALVKAASSQTIAFSYSDLVQKITQQTLFQCISNNTPFNMLSYKAILEKTEPSPLIVEKRFSK